MDDLYREQILEHYKNPHHFGEITDADITQEGDNPLCGDVITLYLKLDDGRVGDVRFRGRGCAISQASASMLTDMIVGKPVRELKSQPGADEVRDAFRQHASGRAQRRFARGGGLNSI